MDGAGERRNGDRRRVPRDLGDDQQHHREPLLAIWRPFRLGDNVELLPENLKGRAIDRNLMFTVLREDSGALLQVPNNLFFQKMFRVHGGS